MQITAREPATGRTLALTIGDGTITAVDTVDRPAALWLAPALIDIQVNGYGGFDFNAPEPAAETAANAIVALRSAGVGLCCPTVTTGGFDQIACSLRAIVGACQQDTAIAHAVAGIHLEGPYISPLDGPRGAHPLDHVRPPDWAEFQRWQEA
ncbi:MAG TPA: N-acetylglucosamine-6-phosphate deacetylase, partial [Chloroflexota bacterium]|nr:N-acetylglucosamine-6-phosphate deacetylase [Chloroflexota bacterium]